MIQEKLDTFLSVRHCREVENVRVGHDGQYQGQEYRSHVICTVWYVRGRKDYDPACVAGAPATFKQAGYLDHAPSSSRRGFRRGLPFSFDTPISNCSRNEAVALLYSSSWSRIRSILCRCICKPESRPAWRTTTR